MAVFLSDENLNKGLREAGFRLVREAELETGEKVMLGQGEQGRVYRVVKESIDKQFAVKVVVPQEAEFSEKEAERFSREVACMAALAGSPHIVSVIDKFMIGKEALCYVMEFIRAQNLKQLLLEQKMERERGPDHLIDIFWQISKGLWIMHHASVAHRDLKEANIMVSKDILDSYNVIIADFGFGYNYSRVEGNKPSPPKQASSYAREGAQLGIRDIGLDFFCFYKIIDSALTSSNALRRSSLAQPLQELMMRLNSIAKEASQIEDPNGAVKFDEEVYKSLVDIRRRANILRIEPELAKLLVVPELTDVGDGDVIRLAGGVTVPLTQRIVTLLDSPPFQRLKVVTQLANVSYVYPGASHSRFEHSLGVFNIARLVMRRLIQAAGAFLPGLKKGDVEKLLLAAILHDIGHVPHSHALEELEMYHHETTAAQIILQDPIKSIIESNWDLDLQELADLLTQEFHERPIDQVLRSILARAIDIDTMDYLYRDSVHLGVPYGNSFDMERLIFSITINKNGDGLAVTHKGIVPAETFLIARYAMFSQVYFHHTVRALTSMLQRAIWEKLQACRNGVNKDTLIRDWSNLICCDLSVYRYVAGTDTNTPEYEIIGPLARGERSIYKRFCEVTGELREGLTELSFTDRVQVSNSIVEELKQMDGLGNLKPWDILIDVPKQKFQNVSMDVYFDNTHSFDPIVNHSPIIKALGEGFDLNTRKVRIFVSSRQTAEKILAVKQPVQIEPIIRKSLSNLRKKRKSGANCPTGESR